jgi:diguanylate cyclase (GGDEF)-like protein
MPKEWNALKNKKNSDQQVTDDNDIVESYRNQVFFWLAISIVIILVPFSVTHLLSGLYVTATTTLTVVVLLAVNAWVMRKGLPPLIPPAIVFIPVVATFVVSIPELGVNVVFWAYPSLLLFFFTLRRLYANVLGAALILLLTLMTYYYVGHAASLRVVVTLIITMLFANIFIGIVIKLQKHLQKLATVDPLTGAYNRRYMDVQLKNAIETKKRYDGQYYLLMLDVDYFKKINDQHGHSVGDRILQAIVELIKHNIRCIDSVYRIGGEEFVVLMQGGDAGNGVRVAEKLRACIENVSYLPNDNVTVSIGVADMNAEDTVDELLRRGDVALYKAKELGRNTVVNYSTLIENSDAEKS